MIPERCIILVAGIPATGKSTFATYLANQHGFVHYDLENFPNGWPRTDFKPLWDSSRAEFVAAISREHRRVVLDWGFPPLCIPWVRELESLGVSLVWFDGNIGKAREVFERRGGISLELFDTQVAQIQASGLPGLFNCMKVLPVLSASGEFMEEQDIINLVFT